MIASGSWSAGLVTAGDAAGRAIGIRRALAQHGQALRWSNVQRRLAILLTIATLATAGASAIWVVLAQLNAAPEFLAAPGSGKHDHRFVGGERAGVRGRGSDAAAGLASFELTGK